MKSIITTLLIFFIASHSNAQCILLKVSFSDCQMCRGSFANFSPQKTGLPAYVVFPSKKMADSSDIEYLGKFRQSGLAVVYNDVWYHKLIESDCTSCAFGLNRNGQVAYQAPLSHFEPKTFQQYLQENMPEKVDDGGVQFIAYRDSLKYVFDLSLGNLAISNSVNGKIIKNIKSSGIDLGLFQNKLTGKEKVKFDQYGTFINTSIVEFAAIFRSFQIAPDGDIYMDYQYHNTPDSISNNITDELCLFRYSSVGKLKDVYLLHHDNNLVLYDFSFLIENNNSFYINTCTLAGFESDLKKGAKSIKYIAHFVLKDGQYEFDNYVPLEIPYLYKRKYFENELSSNGCYFPYISNSLSNDIYNVLTKKTINIIPDSVFKHNILNDTVLYWEHEHFYTFGINADKKNDVLILPYRFYENLYINVYSKDLQLLRSNHFYLNNIDKIRSINTISSNPDMNQLEITYTDRNDKFNIVLPLNLLSNN